MRAAKGLNGAVVISDAKTQKLMELAEKRKKGKLTLEDLDDKLDLILDMLRK